MTDHLTTKMQHAKCIDVTQILTKVILNGINE